MKNHKIILAVFAVFFLVGSMALAQEEVAPSEKPLAGWDNGFFLRSADDQFKMKIGGRVQVKQETQKISGVQKRAVGGRATVADTFSDTFSIRRARVQTTGTLFEKVDWAAILNVSTASQAGGRPGTDWYADVTYNIAPYFRVDMGIIQLPMDRMNENSSAWLLSVEPPLTATQSDGVKDLTTARDSFGLPLDLGIRFDGDVGKYFSYAFGVGNGDTFRSLNHNNELSYGARIQVNALDAVGGKETDFEWSEKPKLSFGAGIGIEDHDTPDENVAAVTRRWSFSSSGDVAFRWHGFSLNSELYYRVVKLSATTVEDTNRDRKLKDIGYYGNAGYYVIPHKLEFVVTAAQIFREGPDNNANEFGGGLNWYIHKGNVKLQLDYTNVLDYDEVPGLNNATYHRIRAMFSTFL